MSKLTPLPLPAAVLSGMRRRLDVVHLKPDEIAKVASYYLQHLPALVARLHWLETHRVPELLTANTRFEAQARASRREAARSWAVNDGNWWYDLDDTEMCHSSPGEVVQHILDWHGNDDTHQVFQLVRALSLPDVFAAVKLFSEAEREARGDDEPFGLTLHASDAEARAALGLPAKEEAKPEGAAP